MLYFTLWSHEPALHEPVYRARPLSPELDRFLPRKSQKSRFLTQKLINYEHPWNAGRPVYRFSPKIAKQVLSQKISNSTIYRGFAKKKPRGCFFFLLASDPQIGHLKYRFFIYLILVIWIIFKRSRKSPMGCVFFSARLDQKRWKKTTPLRFFPRYPWGFRAKNPRG